MTALPVLLLLQTPPGVALLSTATATGWPRQIVASPVFGLAVLTVTIAERGQIPATVYVIIAVPVPATLVTIPFVALTVAIARSELDHTPPEVVELRSEEVPVQMASEPVIAPGAALTVIEEWVKQPAPA
jgi:anaerobic C4-dicarboxylate transporter